MTDTQSDEVPEIEEDFDITLSDAELEDIRQEVYEICSQASLGWLEILVDAGWVDEERHGDFLATMGYLPGGHPDRGL